MKPNLKTPGGFVVLPYDLGIMGISFTWEAYKAKYGVDLDDIFEIKEGVVGFRKDFKKPIYIAQNYDNSLPPVVPLTSTISVQTEDEKGLKLVISQLDTSDGISISYLLALYVKNDRTILVTEI